MAARPNLRAFEILGKQHKEANEVAELERMCKKTLPAMKTDIERYVVLDKCIQFSGASTVEGGLRWASKKDVEFYREKRAEVARGQAELDERHRAEDARQREKWHEEDKERERKRSDQAGCERQCESVHSLCRRAAAARPVVRVAARRTPGTARRAAGASRNADQLAATDLKDSGLRGHEGVLAL